MASIRKTTGGWQAQIAILGTREARRFSTKAEAASWAAELETQIRRQQSTGIDLSKTVGDAFDRYGAEVSLHKKKTKWEQNRLKFIGEQQINGKSIKSILLQDMSSDLWGRWRDHRLNVDKVETSTINRDFSLISNVYTVARREWKWIATSPTTDVRRLKDPESRNRRISQDEIDRITLASGFDELKVTKVRQCVGVAFLFAIETAMRAGELCGLTTATINGTVATLLDTKNGTRRHVPLSKRALELLSFLPTRESSDPLFGLTTASLDANYRKIRAAAAVDELTFHDTRHEAIVRLSSKLNVLELARAVGHRDLKMLQIYYNETAENLAQKLG
ncbi:tyrosine-type recombinase/integrase [Duganella sp. CY15W]|uniref:tyrosine-type recombinase/integrase n=1 Tax=Duganella sp. CY15W TaxID=2692172 RepID=UPI00136D6807|nr:site-specific integrase [Duganella sp. CY15W]MYM32541.1 tyrosine-type recombinase/integrase [Duganella sp. CY15W]